MLYGHFGCEVIAYRNSDFSEVTSSKNCGKPILGIFVNSKEQLFVICGLVSGCRIRIFDRSLKFKKEFNLNYELPGSVREWLVRMREDLLYFIIETQLFVFNNEGKYIHSVLFREGISVPHLSYYDVNVFSFHHKIYTYTVTTVFN